MEDDIVELHAIVRGRVQGVGFRWIVSDLAGKLDLKGVVRNLSDGSVEIYAQGTRTVLYKLLEGLKGDVNPGNVESISTEYSHPKKLYDHFTVEKSRPL